MPLWPDSRRAKHSASSDPAPARVPESDAWLSEDESEAEPKAATPSRSRKQRVPRVAANRPPADPVAQRLITTMLVILILTLVTIVYALATNLFGSGAPRTAAEQQIVSFGAKIEAGSRGSDDWKGYITALIDDGQYDKAQEYIDKGKSVIPQQEIYADMLYMQAELYWAQGDADKALAAADETLNTIKNTYESEKAASQQSGVPSPAVAGGLVINYWEALLLKGEILEAEGDLEGALAVYDEYLAEKGTIGRSVYALRGRVKEQLGDLEGAEADYRTTLEVIKDDTEALAGLERIGANR